MRVLEILSAALAAASAAIIFSFPSSQGDTSLLNLAGIFCLAIALYQVVNLYFGLTLHPRRGKNEVEGDGEIPVDTKELPQPLIEQGEKEFVELPSITENTTELLRSKPRAAEHKQHQ